MGYRTYANSNGFIVAKNGTGDFTSIQAGITASIAAGNNVLFLTPDTYTENLSITGNIKIINLSEDYRDGFNSVQINGTITISNNNTNVVLQNLAINPTVNYGINCTGNVQSLLLSGCNFSIPLGVTGINSTGINTNIYNFDCFYATQGQLLNVINGVLWFFHSRESDFVSPTPSIINSSSLYSRNSILYSQINLTNTPANISYTTFGNEFSPYVNQTFLNLINSGATIDKCSFYSGTASAINLDIASLLNLSATTIRSSNANAISGLGTITLTDVNLLDSKVLQPTLDGSFETIIGTLRVLNNSPYTQPQLNDISTNTSASVNTGYMCIGALILTLPASPSQSDRILVVTGTGSSVIVKANAGQAIRFDTTLSSTGGILTSTAIGQSVTLIYRAADSTWYSIAGAGSAWSVS